MLHMHTMSMDKNTLGVFLILSLCDIIVPLSVPPINQFSLQVQCVGPGGSPGFGARAVKTYFSISGKDQVEFTEPCTDTGNGEGDLEECLFEKFVLSLAREVCQGKESTTFERLNINRTFVGESSAPSQDYSDTTTSVVKENQQENIASLKLGIALGTIFGFLFGATLAGSLLVMFRKFKRNNEIIRNPTTTVTKATTSEDNVKTGDQNEQSNNYMYCDIEDGNYQVPREMTCTGINDSGASLSYDCNPLTYNHLNENNDVDVSTKYDHFREASADARMQNGEYNVLEPVHSQDEMHSNKTAGKSPTNNDNAQRPMTNGEYKILEPLHSQDHMNSNKTAGNLSTKYDLGRIAMSREKTSTDAYFVLEKEIQ